MSVVEELDKIVLLFLLQVLFEGLWLGLNQGVASDVIQNIAYLGDLLSHSFFVEVVLYIALFIFLLMTTLEEGAGNYRVIVALILDFRGHGAPCFKIGLHLADF